MASTFSFIFLFTNLLASLTPSPFLAHNSTGDLVKVTCSHTPDPDMCESELRSDPRSSKVTDTEGLILIMIDAVRTRFTDSLQYVENLTRKTRDPGVKWALKECIRVYRVVLDYNVGVATTAVKQGVPKFGEQAMVDSGNEAEVCKSGFPGGKIPGQLAGRTRILHGVSNVAASLIKTLE